MEEGAGSPGHPVGLETVPASAAAGQSSLQTEDPTRLDSQRHGCQTEGTRPESLQ